jgi:hypothetical protein
MASRILENRVIELERAISENMSGGFPAHLPRGQGNRVEVEESVVAVEGMDELGN